MTANAPRFANHRRRRWILLIAVAACVAPVRLAAQSLDGFLQPHRSIELSFADSGVISELGVEEGDRVGKGQTVARLDSRVLRAELAIARARLESTAAIDAARAEYRRKYERYERLAALRASGHARAEEVASADADRRIAEAEFRLREEQRRIAELEVARIVAEINTRILKSPIDGVIVSVDREVGERVTPTESRVVTVAALDRLRLDVYAPPDTAARLGAGQAVAVDVQGAGVLRGEIAFLSPLVDARSGTRRVRVVLDNPERHLQAGLRASVVFGGSGS